VSTSESSIIRSTMKPKGCPTFERGLPRLSIATLAALLFSFSPYLLGAQQSDIQRAAQARAAQIHAEQSHAKEILGQDWKLWTESDCDLVLKYSNWVTPSGMAGTLSGGLVIQLRSALPIREALLRQLQLKKHYDTMDPQQKLAFDKMNPAEMTETVSDPILLYVEHDATYSGREGNLGSVDPPQQAAIELADGTLLMPTKTEALEYGDKNKIVYSFSRVINGQPLLQARYQKLNFVFGKPLAATGRILPLQDPSKFQINDAKLADMRFLQRVWFATEGLMYGGKLEY
jgi:hypothetical protein